MKDDGQLLVEGDRVEKRRGYKFPGVVVSVFLTRGRERRLVVEADHPDFAGMLHIFKDDDLLARPGR